MYIYRKGKSEEHQLTTSNFKGLQHIFHSLSQWLKTTSLNYNLIIYYILWHVSVQEHVGHYISCIWTINSIHMYAQSLYRWWHHHSLWVDLLSILMLIFLENFQGAIYVHDQIQTFRKWYQNLISKFNNWHTHNSDLLLIIQLTLL